LDVLGPWGKARKEQVPHPLVCHVIDTMSVAEAAFPVLLGSQCREELVNGFAPLGQAELWIVLLCGLHDLGKCTPTFQALRADLAVEWLGEDEVGDVTRLASATGLGRTDTPHGLLTAFHIEHLLRRWGATPTVARQVAVVLGGHHGIFPDAGVLQETANKVGHHGQQRWTSRRDALVDQVIDLWGLPNPTSLPWNQVRLELAGSIGLAGLTSVSDWIASDTTNFPYAGTTVNLSEYCRTARGKAAAIVERIGLGPWLPPADTRFAALFPEIDPRPIQTLVEGCLRGFDGAGIVVIEAPTGEGKTKAVLQAATVLVQRLGLAGMYLGTPTRATSNQMFAEVDTFIQDQASDLRVRLLHSTAQEYLIAERLRARTQAGESKPGDDPVIDTLTPTDVGRDEDGDGDELAREWFTLRRALLAAVGTGTVDQALRAAIRSRFVAVPLTGLSNKVLIVDEVHAYDTHMSTLLDRLLWWAGRLGVPVILASATLPAGRREDLVRSWSAGATRQHPRDIKSLPPEAGYPRVSWSDGYNPRTDSTEASELNTRTVRLAAVPADISVVDLALAEIETGGCVAVIHNVVRHAVATHQSLRKAIDKLPESRRPDLILLTGRLPTGERHHVETDLREKFGKDGSRPRAVVVGTSALENSLDLDFDAMISDLAPIDSLIQRMGRLHRFDLTTRPAKVREPRLWISGVRDTPTGPRFPTYTTSVHQPAVLYRTWVLVRSRSHISVPEDVPGLVDDVYGPDKAVPCPAGWEQAWSTAADRMRRARAQDEAFARTVYLPQPWDGQALVDLTDNPASSRLARKDSHNRGQGRR
jgi:CRISPR-associated endonuclease/helicase Cas3